MSVGEFTGMGLALGVVRGARSFDIDKLGRLTGVSYAQVWTPGENRAECRAGQKYDFASVYSSLMGLSAYAYRPGTGTAPASQITIPAKKRRSIFTSAILPVDQPAEIESIKVEEPDDSVEIHNAAECSCGFYGYYDGSNDYRQAGRVSAVVEGYGETVIGTRGFRSYKARIVALRIHNSVQPQLARLVARNYSEIPLFDSFKRMVAEFPPDAGDSAITPETDADFWTRSI